VLKLGLAQFRGSRHREDNVQAVRRLARKAAEQGSRLLCFHELANTIYPAFTEDPQLFAMAESEDGPSVGAARAVARECGLVMVYPFFEKDGDRFFNTALIVGPHGETLGKYRKTSIPLTRLLPRGSERYYFHYGDLGFPVVQTPFGIRVGVIICYERNLPEPARCVALGGADLLFVPVTTTERARSRWEVLLRARAIENIMYVAAASRVGEDVDGAPGVYYLGESLVIDPAGNVIGRGNPSNEDLVFADIDVQVVHERRKDWRFLDDRQPGQYEALVRR
jgi:beta-ureidopropionase